MPFFATDKDFNITERTSDQYFLFRSVKLIGTATLIEVHRSGTNASGKDSAEVEFMYPMPIKSSSDVLEYFSKHFTYRHGGFCARLS